MVAFGPAKPPEPDTNVVSLESLLPQEGMAPQLRLKLARLATVLAAAQTKKDDTQ